MMLEKARRKEEKRLEKAERKLQKKLEKEQKQKEEEEALKLEQERAEAEQREKEKIEKEKQRAEKESKERERAENKDRGRPEKEKKHSEPDEKKRERSRSHKEKKEKESPHKEKIDQPQMTAIQRERAQLLKEKREKSRDEKEKSLRKEKEAIIKHRREQEAKKTIQAQPVQNGSKCLISYCGGFASALYLEDKKDSRTKKIAFKKRAEAMRRRKQEAAERKKQAELTAAKKQAEEQKEKERKADAMKKQAEYKQKQAEQSRTEKIPKSKEQHKRQEISQNAQKNEAPKVITNAAGTSSNEKDRRIPGVSTREVISTFVPQRMDTKDSGSSVFSKRSEVGISTKHPESSKITPPLRRDYGTSAPRKDVSPAIRKDAEPSKSAGYHRKHDVSPGTTLGRTPEIPVIQVKHAELTRRSGGFPAVSPFNRKQEDFVRNAEHGRTPALLNKPEVSTTVRHLQAPDTSRPTPPWRREDASPALRKDISPVVRKEPESSRNIGLHRKPGVPPGTSHLRTPEIHTAQMKPAESSGRREPFPTFPSSNRRSAEFARSVEQADFPKTLDFSIPGKHLPSEPFKASREEFSAAQRKPISATKPEEAETTRNDEVHKKPDVSAYLTTAEIPTVQTKPVESSRKRDPFPSFPFSNRRQEVPINTDHITAAEPSIATDSLKTAKASASPRGETRSGPFPRKVEPLLPPFNEPPPKASRNLFGASLSEPPQKHSPFEERCRAVLLNQTRSNLPVKFVNEGIKPEDRSRTSFDAQRKEYIPKNLYEGGRRYYTDTANKLEQGSNVPVTRAMIPQIPIDFSKPPPPIPKTIVTSYIPKVILSIFLFEFMIIENW